MLGIASITLVDFLTKLKPLIWFTIGIVIYSIFIFKFYRFVARRDIFSLNLGKYNNRDRGFFFYVFEVFFYLLEHILILPIFIFFWFIVFVVLISFLTDSLTAVNVLVVAMSLVASIRVTAYITEDLSKDLAKMLPFALLGIFLIDINFYSLSHALSIITSLPALWLNMVYYFVFIIALELILRLFHGFISILSYKKEEPVEE